MERTEILLEENASLKRQVGMLKSEKTELESIVREYQNREEQIKRYRRNENLPIVLREVINNKTNFYLVCPSSIVCVISRKKEKEVYLSQDKMGYGIDPNNTPKRNPIILTASWDDLGKLGLFNFRSFVKINRSYSINFAQIRSFNAKEGVLLLKDLPYNVKIILKRESKKKLIDFIEGLSRFEKRIYRHSIKQINQSYKTKSP
ncbi:hypothetical protein ACUNWD_04660 [Sunxiuqinia sp. A32]|uniref:hypothetical protein n=1 Tax=Sunxiuqinia sp. A32 TaxID=3461496 RepID=UPI004045E03E